jgi:diacylglycerol kinase (ATP)
MRICLYWNETAGEGVSADSLTHLITRAGHTVARVVDELAQLPHHLDSAIDCVVAAGGDGTVAKVGRTLAGGDIPLAILPMGTANNIAASLAIEGTPEQLIDKWADHRIVKIDVGVVRQSGGESYFLESVGAGLIATGISLGRASIAGDADPESQLLQARRLYEEQARNLPAQHLGVTFDGHAMEGEYLLVEVLNTPSIGPGIRLSADVNAADGCLSLVTAGEPDRGALAAYLQTKINGEPANAGLEGVRTDCVELTGVTDIHVDDQLCRVTGGSIAIFIKPAFLSILA